MSFKEKVVTLLDTILFCFLWFRFLLIVEKQLVHGSKQILTSFQSDRRRQYYTCCWKLKNRLNKWQDQESTDSLGVSDNLDQSGQQTESHAAWPKIKSTKWETRSTMKWKNNNNTVAFTGRYGWNRNRHFVFFLYWSKKELLFQTTF